MALYSVYLPRAWDGTRASLVDQARLVPDGFSFWGFLFPLLWLLWHRVWLSFLLILALDLALAAAGARLDVAPGLVALSGFVVMGLVGLEGRSWVGRALERRGYRLIEVVEAADPDAALHHMLANWADVARAADPATPPSGSVRSTSGPVSTPTSRGVIGLFPTPDSQR